MPAVTDTVLRSEPAPGVALLTLNRPAQLNAMSYELLADLHAQLDALVDDRSVRVVVLTGAGRGFCAGLDLFAGAAVPGTEDLGRQQATLAIQKNIAALVPKLRGLRQPVIAAVNGAAAGGGFALTLASDIRIAASSARFNVAFVRIGLSGCDIGVSWLLPRLIGAGRAWELMLTGRIIDSAEADRLGLLADVVPDDALLDTALEKAAQIAANSPFGVAMTKEVMWSQLEIPSLQAGIDLENRTQLLAGSTEDAREAMAAFVEKRPAVFRDR
jgi:enoyl-CoA hydratase